MFKNAFLYPFSQKSGGFTSYRQAFLLLPILIFASFAGAQTNRLESDQAITQEIKPGQKRAYQFRTSAGYFFRISVQQQPGVDLILTLYDAKHRKLAAVGGYGGRLKTDSGFSLEAWFDIVSLSFIAEAGGVYEIELDARDTQISGRYEIKLNDVHPAADTDRKRVEAERLFEQGEQLRLRNRGKEDLLLALQRYEEVLKTYRDLGDIVREAVTLDVISNTYWGMDANDDKAMEFSEMALKLCRAAGDRRKEAVLLLRLSQMRREKNQTAETTTEFEKSVAEVEQSLEIWRALGDKRGEAHALHIYAHSRGRLYMKAEDLPEIKNIFRQSLELFREIGSPVEEALVLFGMGTYLSFVSEDRQSIEAFQQGLEILKPTGYKRYIVFGLLRVGENYYEHSDYQNAFNYYSEALEYSRNTNSYYEAYTLYNLANTTLTLDKKKVLEYLNRALPIWESDHNGEAYTLVSIGRFYFSENQNRKALEFYRRALPIMRDTGDMYGVGIILSNIGETYFAMNETAEAIEYYDRALELHRSAKNRRDEARTLLRLGEVHKSSGETEKAFLNYKNALKLYRAIGNRSGEANALYTIAKADRDRGDFAAARTLIEESLRIVEMLRAGIAGEELRSAYFSSVRIYYDFYIDILMKLHEQYPDEGFDRLALEISERARARTLLELLAASQVDLRQGVDKALLDKEDELQKKLDAKSAEQVRMLVEPHTEKQAVEVAKEIEELSNDLQAVKARINTASPRFAALTQTNSLNTQEIQNLLTDDTILLEYALGEERSFLWMVTADKVKSFALPKRAEIEKLARSVYESLTARNRRIKGETDREAQARFDNADTDFQKASLNLSRILLGPVRQSLGNKRLVIVSDGALQYIPFAALPVESGEEPAGKLPPDPLILDHEIISLPSASTLAVLRRESAKRPPAPQTVAVLADPVFSKKDARVKAIFNQTPKGNFAAQNALRPPEIKFSTMRALAEFELGKQTALPRLPFSRREAEMIVSMAPSKTWLKALDFEADRTTATSPELSRYRIVHFATHGLLNSSHPELSGLLFSLVNERGEPQNGFLPLQDIYNLKLNADLVVLSACQTGLGKEIRGEGLVGLTRGFMYAGSPRVAASLWKVDDAATAGLMQYFYKAILRDKQSPAAALRSAQIQMWKGRIWKQPYFWAAFVIQGEWK